MASWFRSWHGAPTDNKWLVIGRRANVAPGVVSAVAWALMDYASQADDRGSVNGFDVETYCAFSGFAEDDISRVLCAMSEKSIIIDGRLAAWDKRQPKREDDSYERVRAFRERKNVTQDDCNAEKRNVTQRNNTDTDTDTDQIQIRTDAETDLTTPAPNGVQPRAPKADVTQQQAMFGAIVETCQLDANLQKSQIGKTAAALVKAGYTPEQVRGFTEWWLSDSWRMEHTPVPTLQQLMTKIVQFKNGVTTVNGNGNGRMSNVEKSLAAVDSYFKKKEAMQHE